MFSRAFGTSGVGGPAERRDVTEAVAIVTADWARIVNIAFWTNEKTV